MCTTVKNKVGGATRGLSERLQERGSSVNWEDFNYPPLIEIVHYDINDLEEPGPRAAVLWTHANYLFSFGILALNIVATLVLAIGGVSGKGVEVLYSFFNIIIFAILGMYSFYHAYKGLATQNARLTTKFFIVEAVLLIFRCVCALVGASNFNGWLNLKRAKDSGKMSDFWVGWTIFESLLWTCAIIICVVTIILVSQVSAPSSRDATRKAPQDP
ncbi:hypothetical protein CYMTET_38037 [Cymbomonas tetramitiformis]|uniref:Secretory carrier-associated membrane protein n=1 Tax=Cymbomonas tetramitiformis TaxID=36881 RepID=A0AAE0CE40_9CHLO|nr:hypothetical protein CYMTET_38037 [Cymbomonas tetramitiformis]